MVMLNADEGMLKKASEYGKSHSMTSSSTASGKETRTCLTSPSRLSSAKTTGADADASPSPLSGGGSSAADAGTQKVVRASVIIKSRMTAVRSV